MNKREDQKLGEDFLGKIFRFTVGAIAIWLLWNCTTDFTGFEKIGFLHATMLQAGKNLSFWSAKEKKDKNTYYK